MKNFAAWGGATTVGIIAGLFALALLDCALAILDSNTTTNRDEPHQPKSNEESRPQPKSNESRPRPNISDFELKSNAPIKWSRPEVWRLPDARGQVHLEEKLLECTPLPGAVVNRILIPLIGIGPYLIGDWFRIPKPRVFDVFLHANANGLKFANGGRVMITNNPSTLRQGRCVATSDFICISDIPAAINRVAKTVAESLQEGTYDQTRFRVRIADKGEMHVREPDILIGLYHHGFLFSSQSGIMLHAHDGWSFCTNMYNSHFGVAKIDGYSPMDFSRLETNTLKQWNARLRTGTKQERTLSIFITVHSQPVTETRWTNHGSHRVFMDVWLGDKKITPYPFPLVGFRFNEPYHFGVESQYSTTIRILPE